MIFTYDTNKGAFTCGKFPLLDPCLEGKSILGIPYNTPHGSRLIVSRTPFKGAVQVTMNSDGGFIIKKNSLSSSASQCKIVASLITGREISFFDDAIDEIKSYPKLIRFYVKYESAPALNLTIGKRYKLTKYERSGDYIVAQVDSFRYLFINLHNGNRLSNSPCGGAYDDLSSMRDDALNKGYTIEPLS